MGSSEVPFAVFGAFAGAVIAACAMYLVYRRWCRDRGTWEDVSHGLDEEEKAFKTILDHRIADGSAANEELLNFDLDMDDDVEFESAELEQLKLLTNIGSATLSTEDTANGDKGT